MVSPKVVFPPASPSLMFSLRIREYNLSEASVFHGGKLFSSPPLVFLLPPLSEERGNNVSPSEGKPSPFNGGASSPPPPPPVEGRCVVFPPHPPLGRETERERERREVLP